MPERSAAVALAEAGLNLVAVAAVVEETTAWRVRTMCHRAVTSVTMPPPPSHR